MEEEKKKRGGARPGAGRKKQDNSRNIRVGLSLSPEAYAFLEQLVSQSGTNKNDVINRLLEQMAKSQAQGEN